MSTVPIDQQAAYRAGQADAFTRFLAEMRGVVAALEAELARLSPAPLPSRLPTFPQLPQGPQGGEVR
jgi:hypothetical protein